MVIDDFNLVFLSFFPAEDDAPLLIDSNTPEAAQVSAELFESVAWGNLKVLNNSCLIDHAKLSSGTFLDVSRETAHAEATVDFLSLGIAKTFDH